ncbi:MAG: hypothetical protein JEY99_10430 [Spirochaetales bacterium]|nr:hypothetical protein [Spirochaetales bacterium]
MDNIKKSRIITYIILISACFPAVVSAQLQVEFKTPPLLPEMSGLEGLLKANIGFAVDEIQVMAGELLQKPELTSSCGRAAGVSGTLSTLGTPWSSEAPIIKTGMIAGAITDTFDLDEIAERFDNLQPEDDFTLGAGAAAVDCSLKLPLDFLVPDSTLSISGSYMDLAADEYFINGNSGSAALGWTPLQPLKTSFISWLPLQITAGAGWTANKIGSSIAAGMITESFEIDLDGSGPFPGTAIEVQVDPVIDVAISSQTWNFSGSLSSGIRLADFFSFFIGGGVSYIMGATGITVDSAPGYLIIGFFEQYIDVDELIQMYGEDKAQTQHGEITISGEVVGGKPDGFTGFFYGGFRFDLGPLFMDIPILYTPPYTLGTGISLGVEL